MTRIFQEEDVTGAGDYIADTARDQRAIGPIAHGCPVADSQVICTDSATGFHEDVVDVKLAPGAIDKDNSAIIV